MTLLLHCKYCDVEFEGELSPGTFYGQGCSICGRYTQPAFESEKAKVTVIEDRVKNTSQRSQTRSVRADVPAKPKAAKKGAKRG